MVYSAEQEAQVLRLDVEPDILQEEPELGAGEQAAPFRVVLVEDRLFVCDPNHRLNVAVWGGGMVGRTR